MAKNDLVLNVGTRYNGEGLKKLDNAIVKSSGNIKRVGGIIGAVSGQLEGMGGQAGKAAGALGRLAGAAAGMGVWGVVLTGVTMAVGKLVEWFGRADEQAKKLAQTFRDNLAKAADDTKKSIDALNTAFDKNRAAVANSQKAADTLASAQNERRGIARQREDLNASPIQIATRNVDRAREDAQRGERMLEEQVQRAVEADQEIGKHLSNLEKLRTEHMKKIADAQRTISSAAPTKPTPSITSMYGNTYGASNSVGGHEMQEYADALKKHNEEVERAKDVLKSEDEIVKKLTADIEKYKAQAQKTPLDVQAAEEDLRTFRDKSALEVEKAEKALATAREEDTKRIKAEQEALEKAEFDEFLKGQLQRLEDIEVEHEKKRILLAEQEAEEKAKLAKEAADKSIEAVRKTQQELDRLVNNANNIQAAGNNFNNWNQNERDGQRQAAKDAKNLDNQRKLAQAAVDRRNAMFDENGNRLMRFQGKQFDDIIAKGDAAQAFLDATDPAKKKALLKQLEQQQKERDKNIKDAADALKKIADDMKNLGL